MLIVNYDCTLEICSHLGRIADAHAFKDADDHAYKHVPDARPDHLTYSTAGAIEKLAACTYRLKLLAVVQCRAIYSEYELGDNQ